MPKAAHVKVTLEERDDGVWMEIEDDGDGFEPTAAVSTPGHLGLVAMRERAEMAGGWSPLQSLPGAGTVLQVWLPHVGDGTIGAGDELRDGVGVLGSLGDVDGQALAITLVLPVSRSGAGRAASSSCSSCGSSCSGRSAA